MKNIVLVIDWQNPYFAENKTSRYMEDAVSRTARIIEQAQDNGDQVAWIALYREPYQASLDLFDGRVNPCGLPASAVSFHPDLVPLKRPDAPLFTKRTSDGFPGINPETGQTLKDWLAAQEFDQLIYTGYHITDCVLATLMSGINAGYGPKTVLARDACGDGPKTWRSDADIFNQINQFYGGKVTSAARVIKSLRERTPVARHLPFGQNPVRYGKMRDDKLPCAFYTAKNEIENPHILLSGYQSYKRLEKRGYSRPESAERYSETIMKMWARAHDVDYAEVEAIGNDPENHALYNDLEHRLAPKSKVPAPTLAKLKIN